MTGTIDSAATRKGPADTREAFTGNLAIPRYELEGWRQAYGVVAGITGRGGGFDLNLWSRDSVGSVMTRWRTFGESVRSSFPGIVLSHQRHGADVESVEHTTRGLLIKEGIDGHATTEAGVLLVVTVADCVPVYLLHVPTKTVALLHAGWRGVALGILKRGVQRLVELSGGQAHEIVMHCGVSVCGECYEVGPDVIEAVTGTRAAQSGLLDLRGVLCEQGEALKLRETTASGWCTVHDAERFYSYRRSKGASGRMVAYLGRPSA